ncbi:serine/threonine-protein kinase PLK1-like [Amblyomma americanum]
MASARPTTSTTAACTDVPDTVVDRITKKEYARGKFLGKGAFAKCYEFRDRKTNKTFAGKVVSKELLLKPGHKEKVSQEIEIHRSLNHQHIVAFQSCFEDEENVYIILELCSRQSLMEVIRRRKTLTEGEARYFMRQLLLACRYLREQRVVHRDLKLGNLLLNEGMELKVADFGLATRIGFEGQRRKTFCGTPRYIAPEVLSKKGHSYEVDVWSIGCILYTLLVGRTPFEATTLEETYALIKANKYRIPYTVSAPARALIQRMLQLEPGKRPSINAILEDAFINRGPIRSHLPTSCLAIPPRFETVNTTRTTDGRRPFLERNEEREPEAKVTGGKNLLKKEAKPAQSLKSKQPARSKAAQAPPEAGMQSPAQPEGHRRQHLENLQRLLRQLFRAQPPERSFERPDQAEDPASTPVYWISKWVDYSDRHGIGYQLCDSSTGVHFNDDTRLILLNNEMSITYVDENGLEYNYTMKQYPSTLEKKVTLLKYFWTFMKGLSKTGLGVSPRDCDDLVRLPYLGSCLRTRHAMSFYLTNGTVQVNFFQDHTKIILCPLMAAVTYIDADRVFHTYRLKTLQQGCPPKLLLGLQYTSSLLGKMASE